MAEGESIIATFPRVFLRIKGADAGLFSSGSGGYPGTGERKVIPFIPKLREGSLFVTDRRIVYIRRQIDWRTGFLAYVKGARVTDAPAGAPGDVLACGAIEYCEIYRDDIERLERGLFGGKLGLDARGRRYVVRLTKRQADAVGSMIQST